MPLGFLLVLLVAPERLHVPNSRTALASPLLKCVAVPIVRTANISATWGLV